MYALPMTDQAEIAQRIAEAGQRAKAEADARRATEPKKEMPPELGGPKGPEPTRYGDWKAKASLRTSKMSMAKKIAEKLFFLLACFSAGLLPVALAINLSSQDLKPPYLDGF